MRIGNRFAEVETEPVYEFLELIGCDARANINSKDFDLAYINHLAAKVVEKFDYLSFYEAHYLIFLYCWERNKNE
jgi:hypothetical protein